MAHAPQGHPVDGASSRVDSRHVRPGVRFISIDRKIGPNKVRPTRGTDGFWASCLAIGSVLGTGPRRRAAHGFFADTAAEDRRRRVNPLVGERTAQPTVFEF